MMSTEPPPDPDRDGDGILNTVDACPDQRETVNNVWDTDGCPDTPRQFYEAVRSDLELYWDNVITDAGLQYSLINGLVAFTQSINTLCGELVGGAWYCGADLTVYYDDLFVGSFLSQVGDGAPAFIIAHEIGHHVGFTILGWLPGVAITPSGAILTTKESELMADCFAGAWVANVGARGLLEPGDLQEIAVTLFAIGDPAETWFDPTEHGTVEQRGTATDFGYTSGPGICTDQTFFDLFPASEN